MSLRNCWNCGAEFDNHETSVVDCPDCKRTEREMRAEEAVGKRGELCFQSIPGCWSPAFVDGTCIRHLGDGKIVVACDDDEERINYIGSFSVYLNQPKPEQMELF